MNKTAIALILYALLTVPCAHAQSSGSQVGTSAISAAEFLGSLGVNTHVSQGYNPEHYVEPLRYLGIHNIRDSTHNISGYIMLHEKTGVRVDLVGIELTEILSSAKTLANDGALMAIEGPNEPNNWPITYKGERGGDTDSWKALAEMQKDLYRSVKDDPLLKKYPVFHVSEGGAETDNVGMQFLTIPQDAETLLPAGTQFADFANPHNYVSGHGGRYVDNQAWQAADPTLNSSWDGLYVEYGKTWRRGYKGYTNEQLQTLPRVTTETGWDSVDGPGGERIQGTIIVNTYLAQFKRGWRYTFIYELGDGEGSQGSQGLYRKDWSAKPAAHYIHNLTAILADTKPLTHPSTLNYSIENQPETVHDLLLQKSNGTFYLVIWGEKTNGSENITLDLSTPHPKVSIYDVTVGDNPILTKNNVSKIPFALNDHAIILEIN